LGKLGQLIDFTAFMIQSTNQHGIHSPTLFDFYNQVIDDERNFYVFQQLETIRHSYFRNHNKLEIVELGAGSSYNQKKEKSISEIAKQQLSGAYQLRVIFRAIEWLQNQLKKPELRIVELGASIGLSTFYLSRISERNKVISFEGNPHFIDFIEYQLTQLHFNNITLIEGNFDNTFKEFTSKEKGIDFIFIDGNHREQATYNYFEWSLSCVHNKSLIVLDDIHWSPGMQKAWKRIIDHPRVKASIDLYFMGIVFLDEDFQEKRHLKIRPKKLTKL